VEATHWQQRMRHCCTFTFKSSMPADWEKTSLQATQGASRMPQSEHEARRPVLDQTPTSRSPLAISCDGGMRPASGHRLSLNEGYQGRSAHRGAACGEHTHHPEGLGGLDEHTHNCSLLSVETPQRRKGNSRLGSARDSAHPRNHYHSLHTQHALATVLLILVSFASSLSSDQTAGCLVSFICFWIAQDSLSKMPVLFLLFVLGF
jgi:hypothetical protein